MRSDSTVSGGAPATFRGTLRRAFAHEIMGPSHSQTSRYVDGPRWAACARARGVGSGIGVAVALLALAPVGIAGQQACPEGRIAEIFFNTHSIFDPDAIPETGGLGWAYELANSAHVSTRESFIRGELLFGEGDCLDPTALRESARILRQFRFIARADVFAVDQPDGSSHVVVDTRDEWSTKFTLNVRFEDRIRFDGASIFEENFLGRGMTLGVFRVDREEQEDVGGVFEVPRLFGTELDARLIANRTSVGDAFEQALVYPFEGEIDRFAARQRISRNEDLFAYYLPGDLEQSHVVVPLAVRRMELSMARRFGRPGRLYLLGGGLSFERVRTGAAEEVGIVRSGDFSARERLRPERFEDELVRQFSSREATRLNALFGLRHLEFETRRGLDAVGGVQDLPVGTEAVLSIGRSLGDTGPGRPADTFARLDALHGRVGERSIGVFVGSLEGRREDAHTGVGVSWHDVLLEGHAFLYLLPGGPMDQTLVLRGAVQGGWRTAAPFQLALGGPDGVRGYTETELPGGRRVVFSAEDRFRLPGPFSELVDLGLAAFVDVGRMWAGDAPFGVDSGWRGTYGAGIRFGFPSGSSTVIRMDLAFPVGPGASAKSPVFRISAQEWVGVLNEFRSPRMRGARRSGITGEYQGVGRETTAW